MCMVYLLAVIPRPREAETEEKRCVTETKQLCVYVCASVTSDSHAQKWHNTQLNSSDQVALKQNIGTLTHTFTGCQP